MFDDKRDGSVEHIVYHEPEGIIGFIQDLNRKKEVLHDPVYFKGEADGIEVEVTLQYVNEFHENVLGFCNNIYNAEGGTRLTPVCERDRNPERKGCEFYRCRYP